MISLLKSKFDKSPRRAIFLGNDKLTVYHWVNGNLGSSYIFDSSDDGQNYFERYLKETGRMTTYMLVDMVEEEYRQDTIPHVYGPDRKALIERKKTRLFRDTPYFYADIQGRKLDGRRDDEVVFMALTNPALLKPWLKLLEDNKVPFAGICSIGQLTKSMLNILPEPSENMLVVSLQSISGLRQSFFQNYNLKVSRLVGLPRYGTEPYAPIINEEVEIIRRYLNSLRFIDEKPLDVFFLSNNELLDQLMKQQKNTATTIYHYIDVNLLGNQTGLNRNNSTPFCDQLLMYQLLKERLPNCYAQESETRYFQMKRTRQMLYAASIFLVLSGFIWGGLNFLNGVMHNQQSIVASKKAEFYKARYEMAKEKLQQTTVAPAELKIVVDIADTLEKYKADPIDMMKVISKGMSLYSSIQLDEIEWITSTDPNFKLGSTVTTQDDQGILGFSDIKSTDTGYQYYQIASIKGHLKPFDGNYRAALNLIDEFAKTLRGLEHIHDVSIISLPLDVSSGSNLQGASDVRSLEANFSVRIVLGVLHET